MTSESARVCVHADRNGDGSHLLEPGERCTAGDGPAPDIYVPRPKAEKLRVEIQVARQYVNARGLYDPHVVLVQLGRLARVAAEALNDE